jgi:hypothetical protein
MPPHQPFFHPLFSTFQQEKLKNAPSSGALHRYGASESLTSDPEPTSSLRL